MFLYFGLIYVVHLYKVNSPNSSLMTGRTLTFSLVTERVGRKKTKHKRLSLLSKGNVHFWFYKDVLYIFLISCSTV